MQNQIRLPSRAVRERYQVTNRTLDRWILNEKLGFPKPIMINGRRYWDEAEIVEWERSRAAARTALRQPTALDTLDLIGG
jgi:predicted DNA-binding transcriptional regulator AlpA